MKKFKLFANNNEQSHNIEEIIKNKLIKNGFNYSETDYEFAIAIGGDGSFLRMVKQTNFNSEVIYIGVNTGTLGFAQEVNLDNINQFIENLKTNNYKIDNIGVQKTKIITRDTNSIFYSLNEIVIRDKNLNTLFLNIKINEQLLEKFIGDGVLISTSFGSTAYNLSFGGSIVYNTFHTLQITPIAPLNNKSYSTLRNSIVIPENFKIELIPYKKDLLITIDGENNIYDNVQFIETCVFDKKIKCLRNIDYDFIKKVNEKFLN